MASEVRIDRRAGFAWQCPFSRPELAAILAAMRRACGMDAVSLDLVLVDDAHISSVNEAFLGCPGPTNILSFPPAASTRPSPGGPSLGGPSLGGPSLGGAASLVLSLDTLERECLLYGQESAVHTLRLLAHGMAHISGLDHGPAMDALQAAAFAAGMASVAGHGADC